MEASVFMMFMLLLGGGSGNHLLDLVSSENYWKSKDVEITTPAIMLDLNSLKADDTSKPVAVRRLMAIRALGELKSPDAIPSLKVQLDSKEMFVAEYAQRAIDTIEGKAPAKPTPLPADRMKADLYMLPEHCGAVAQLQLVGGQGTSAKKPAGTEAAADPNAANPADPNAPNAGDQQPSPMDAIAMALIGVAEQTGDIRVDGATLGVSDEIGPQQGFVAVYVRGQWDAEAVKSAIQSQFNQTTTAGEVEFMTPQFGGGAVAVPSGELFVITGGPSNNTLPLEDIGVAIKSGKGKLENNADLIKVIEATDTKQPMWAAMIVSNNYAQAPQLAAFESLSLVGKLADDQVTYEAKATGKDADGVKSAVDQMTALINEGRGELGQEVARTPAAQPLLDFMNSIELKSDGTTATGTATMKRGMLLPMMRAEQKAAP